MVKVLAFAKEGIEEALPKVAVIEMRTLEKDVDEDEHSIIPIEYRRKIKHLMNMLEKERKSIIPYPFKKRKKAKIYALNALLTDHTSKYLQDAVANVKAAFKDQGILKGVFSSRTKRLLDEIQGLYP